MTFKQSIAKIKRFFEPAEFGPRRPALQIEQEMRRRRERERYGR